MGHRGYTELGLGRDLGDWRDGLGLPGIGPFGLHGFGPFGLGFFGLGGFGAEHLQMHFENRFEDLMAQYDMGLAEIEDFFNSDQYAKIVERVQRLVDKYDLFLGGLERCIDRLGDIIMIVNDDLSFVNDLIADYEARDDLPAERLERILSTLMHFQDHLEMKVDRLTEKQTTLNENLGTYQMFSDELSAYLAEIVAAGEDAPMEPGQIASQLLSATSMTVQEDPISVTENAPVFVAAEARGAESSGAVPEPSSGVLLAIAAAATTMLRRPRLCQRRLAR
jgi:hypothetical protein